jgi:hypothetical protein
MADHTDFNLLDSDRIVVDTQNTGSFTGGGAYPAGEFREVVGLVENLNGFFPAVLINQIISVRDNIP